MSLPINYEPTLCGEFQAVIAKLRQEGYSLSRLEEALGSGRAASSGGPSGTSGRKATSGYVAARSLFCLREPGLFVDVLQVASLSELRQETQALLHSTCNSRERLRQYAGSYHQGVGDSEGSTLSFLEVTDICAPLLDIVRSPAISAATTAEALAALHRIIADLGLLEKCNEPTSCEKANQLIDGIVDAAVECVFRQTDSGDDEIAVMWALEVLEACCAHASARKRDSMKLERVIVTLYKNSVAGANADMLRRLAVRKLSTLVSDMFRRRFVQQGGPESPGAGQDAMAGLASRLFGFLCRRIDPGTNNWHDMESRQACLELVLTSIIATTNPINGRILIDVDPEIHNIISNDLFRALLQICQIAMKPPGPDYLIQPGFTDGSDMVKVMSMSSLSDELANAQTSDSNENSDAQSSTSSKRGPQQPQQQQPKQVQAKRSASKRGSALRRSMTDHFAVIPTTFAAMDQHYADVARRASEAEHKRRALAAALRRERGSDGGAASGQNNSGIDFLPGSSVPFHGRMPQAVLTRVLRIVHLLIADVNTRRQLRTQIQAFYNGVFLHALGASKASSKSGDTDPRRLVLETLIDLFADPTIAIDLYCNYDCSLDSTDVFENLFIYLSNHSFPKHVRKLALDTLQLMSLRCIHIGIKAICARSAHNAATTDEKDVFEGTVISPEDLADFKAAKRTLQNCANEFNLKPKSGVKALVASQIVTDPPQAAQVAAFLRNTPGLEKPAIGEFLGGGGELNTAVRAAFFSSFEVEGLPMLAALRMILESFRLPGEAQMIDRIVEDFAAKAFAECVDAKHFPTVDCAYLLCFSIILLNTDLHNPNIRPERKMTLAKFITQNENYGADVSKGQKMDLKLLTSIYEEITEREINTMSDGATLTAEVTLDRWRDLVRNKQEMRLVSAGFTALQGHTFTESSVRSLLGRYDKQMFACIHTPAFAALSVVFSSGEPSKQPKAVDMALEGIMNCAEIASRFGMVRVLDRITVDVCKFTSLLLYAHAVGSSSDLGEDSDDDGELSILLDGEDSTDDGNMTELDDESNEDSEDAALGATPSLESEKPPKPPKIKPIAPQSPPTSPSSRSSAKRQTSAASSTTSGSGRASGPDILGSETSIAKTLGDLRSRPKAQTATTSVFEIVHRHGNAVRQAWPHVAYCMLRLFDLQLLPDELLQEGVGATSRGAPFIAPEQRVAYHKAMCSAWLSATNDQVSAAKNELERSKGWVSWLSGESTRDAEERLRSREQDLLRITRAISFASFSIGANKANSSADSDGPDGLIPPMNSRSRTLSSGAKLSPRIAIDRIKLGQLKSIVQDSTTFDLPTLVALVRGLLLAACADQASCPSDADIVRDIIGSNKDKDVGGEDDIRPDITVGMLTPASRASRVFALQILTEVTLATVTDDGDDRRTEAIFPMVKAYFLKTLRTARQPTAHVEKATVGLLRMALAFVQQKRTVQLSDSTASIIKMLYRFPEEYAPGLRQLMLQAFTRAVDNGNCAPAVTSSLEQILPLGAKCATPNNVLASGPLNPAPVAEAALSEPVAHEISNVDSAPSTSAASEPMVNESVVSEAVADESAVNESAPVHATVPEALPEPPKLAEDAGDQGAQNLIPISQSEEEEELR